MPRGRAAVLLDMDGVIVDSELQWKLVEHSFLKSLVPRWSAEQERQIVGLGVVDLYSWLVKNFAVQISQKDFLAHCDEMAQEVYSRRVTLAGGLMDFLSANKKQKRPLGLASSSPRRWIDLVLTRFDLAVHFQTVVSGDDVMGKTKPHPDIYLLAAKNLRVDPKECFAVEDSHLGVRAAKTAGMYCAAYRTPSNADQDLSAADREFSHFDELARA